MPRSPSPRFDYPRRLSGRSEYRDRDLQHRDRDPFPESYRDLDRPPDDFHHERRDRVDRDKYERRERRSRSPPNQRERHRERDRRERRRSPERSGRTHRSRSRSNSRRDRGPPSPRSGERERRDQRHDRDRERRKSKSQSPSTKEEAVPPSEEAVASNPLPDINLDEDPEQAMMALEQAMTSLIGIAGFSTTKGTKVSGNEYSAVNIKKQRQYRQYMNRRGGFNRPLDKVQ
ncbi:hypothetical protein G9A89_013248 [Geosiphon pyriformis]|nr:hypothetical protein G9A89_013248 [Geosiphon pyriformis]